METEEQQVEELKKWWKENGSSIITGIVLGLALLFGTKAWFSYQDRTAQQASAVYAMMIREAEQDKRDAASEKAAALIGDFSGTPYASLAAMLLAKYNIGDKDLDAAASQLQWVIDNAPSDDLRNTAMIRLARVRLGQADYDGALGVAEQLEAAAGQEGPVSELRGDVYSQQGETGRALDAYSEALALMGDEYPGRNIVQLKYDNALAMQGAAEDNAQ